MQTHFSPEQLKSAPMASSQEVIKSCVHCGFCTATCPTYLLLGDELDSPRGRIYLMKEMLEKGGTPSSSTVKHVDRCLSCLSCMTTCPSGVNYMHLVDHARAYIEDNYQRPLFERVIRNTLARILPNPTLFRLSLRLAALGRPFQFLMPSRIKNMIAMAPKTLPPKDPFEKPNLARTDALRRGRVAMLAGCAQTVLAPQINGSTVRLLNRLGFDVLTADGSGCCGALPHHLGKTKDSHAFAKANISAWIKEMDTAGLDAIIVNASGCGTTVKDYGFMFRDDPEWADRAARVSAITKDISETISDLELGPLKPMGMRVAYHAACSLQHGQKIRNEPKALLRLAGFDVVEPNEAHICCGSAGTYNLMQPEIAGQLLERKVKNIAATEPAVIATGNIGCMTQIEKGTGIPVVHTIELLDWATGGPKPEKLAPQQQNYLK